jgi:hypothetical protein
MPLNEEIKFGFEIFDEIREEIQKLKNIYPYSNNNTILNAMVDMCLETINKIENSKKDQ